MILMASVALLCGTLCSSVVRLLIFLSGIVVLSAKTFHHREHRIPQSKATETSYYFDDPSCRTVLIKVLVARVRVRSRR